MVTAMRRLAEIAMVQENACGALGNLAEDHPENQAKIGVQVENIHDYI